MTTRVCCTPCCWGGGGELSTTWVRADGGRLPATVVGAPAAAELRCSAERLGAGTRYSGSASADAAARRARAMSSALRYRCSGSRAVARWTAASNCGGTPAMRVEGRGTSLSMRW